ncbi:amino acid adenylation domain-containing protein [Streptomyces anulatus]|uniref:non-ribosomal peptide synthetase n=1 Tax=Streptomyces anulatus TaxID=1892 RepID=UPI0022570758|nr:amino acid adenylation domain-containing protein [Streptomyces anulatus]MCX4521944.1 amino acid adenylation domain-containing protein [Streptomyces anulatus]MCX4604820.1 amino acid adenylation domain-containing protein [Streptomyces anulatus]WTE29643.1 amino acid adenylation domain-containing protein [Streptomyces anulatus]
MAEALTVEGRSAGPTTIPAARSLEAGFADVAGRYPDRTALVAPDGELTYRELDRRSGSVAAALLARGAGPEQRVGLLLGRGTALLTALLGVLRCGAAFVPFDPALPLERLAFMLADSGARWLLTDRATAASVPGELFVRQRVSTLTGAPPTTAVTPDVQVLWVDRLLQEAPDGVPDLPPVDARSLAYVLYTSGTTGQPKGVAVEHGSVAALVDALARARVTDGSARRVGWNASVSFDASVQQWSRVCRGDTLVLLDDRVRQDPDELARLIERERLTDLDMTPSHLALLVDRLDRTPRKNPLRLLIGGEALSVGLWDELRELEESGAVRAVNLYGPTECTVDATAAPVAERGTPHLGEPLPGVRVHVLDSRLCPVADGEPGEIYLAGSGVARGYDEIPGLTAQRFVPDLFAGDGSRMYRTGDLARRRPGGELEYLGRRDGQVKLRGHRIELGEIESLLMRVPGVRQVVAALHDDLPGGRGIAVHYTSRGGQVPAAALREAAQRELPAYMMPSAFAPVDRIPTTPTGKANRAALASPAAAGSPASWEGVEFVAPDGPMETLLAEAWSAVLGVGPIGALDDFFLLGGQSVLAIRLAGRLRRVLGRAVPMIVVFEHPRLRDLAAHLAGATPPARGPEQSPSTGRDSGWGAHEVDPGRGVHEEKEGGM